MRSNYTVFLNVVEIRFDVQYQSHIFIEHVSTYCYLNINHQPENDAIKLSKQIKFIAVDIKNYFILMKDVDVVLSCKSDSRSITLEIERRPDDES